MALSRSFVRIACAALLATLLAACSLFGAPWSSHHKPAPPPPPPPPPAAAAPTATEKFEIDSKDDVLGLVQITKTSKDDTLTDIARRFNVGYEEIARANPGVDVWLPGAGREVVVPTQFVLPDAPHEGIVVNIAAMRLYYFPPRKKGERQIVYTHPIGIGRVGWRTPGGTTTVVRKAKDPVWRPPLDIIKEHREDGDNLPGVVGPGPDNPLGNRALYLGWPEYLIHGTNKPVGVGMRVSHGCMHLFPEDILELYDLVSIGTRVRVVNQPFVFGWHDGELYMQAYGSLEDDPRNWQKAKQRLLSRALGARTQAELKRLGEQVNWDLVMHLTENPRGVPVPVTEPDASIDEVLASAPRVDDRIPDGSTWDGKTDLPMDEKTYQQIVSETQGSQAAESAQPHPASEHKTGT
jgi:L,D-transpeptidase ErfK/SrfK